MEFVDHYPWSALIADLTAQLLNAPQYPPGGTPARDPVAPAPQRFVKFGDSMVCQTCTLDARYCKGHAPADSPAKDGAGSDLARRIRECVK